MTPAISPVRGPGGGRFLGAALLIWSVAACGAPQGPYRNAPPPPPPPVERLQPQVAVSPEEAAFFDFAPFASPLLKNTAPSPRAVIDPFFKAQQNLATGHDATVLVDTPVAISESHAIMDLTVEGLADQAVRAAQYRMLLARHDGGWRIVKAGKRHKCRHGFDADDWVVLQCP